MSDASGQSGARAVPPEVAAELDALIVKVQAGSARLSECLAEGVAVARKAGDERLREFCERELVVYRIKDGETYPPWRHISSYKFSSLFKLNTQQQYNTTENTALDWLSQQPWAVFGPDIWISDVAHTEDLLRHVASQQRGFSRN